MVSRSLLSLAAGFASVAVTMAASSSTVTTSLLVPGTMPATITASVVDNKHGRTTWALDCGDAGCLAAPSKTLTITENPTTLIYEHSITTSEDSIQETYTLSVGCDIDTKKSHVSCSETYRGREVLPGSTTIATSTTSTTTYDLKATDYFAVVVTAGADKLGDKGAAAPAPTQNAFLAGVAAAVGGAALIL